MLFRSGDIPFNYRNVGVGWVTRCYTGDLDCVVEVRNRRPQGLQVRVDHGAECAARLHGSRLLIGPRSYSVEVDQDGANWWADSEEGSLHLVDVPRFPPPESAADAGSLHSPLPGTVVRVDVAVGDNVHAGDVLVVLEAMKMEHSIRAPHDGVVTELDVSVGSQVETGAVLVIVGAESEA